MATNPNAVPIRYMDPTQDSDELQNIAADVAKILTPNEEILYIALQNITAFSIKKDCVVATTNRVILYRPQVLGRVQFDDIQWQDVKNARIEQKLLASELTVETVDGRISTLGGLDKEQAKRLYGVTQQQEQEWREKRRIREMEEARARSGGIYMNAPAASPSPSAPAESAVERLARAKQLLDQGLISEPEYDTLKAKILADL